jgi:hypothetical protein
MVWMGSGSALQVYINGQLAATANYSPDLSRRSDLRLGAVPQSEALYTHATLYSASA